MKAYLYLPTGEIVAAREVSDTDPPKHIDHNGCRYELAGSGSTISDDGVTQIGWSYLPAAAQRDRPAEP